MSERFEWLLLSLNAKHQRDNGTEEHQCRAHEIAISQYSGLTPFHGKKVNTFAEGYVTTILVCLDNSRDFAIG